MIKFFFFLFVAFLFIGSSVQAQSVIKMRAKYVSHATYEYGRWSEWSDWDQTNILITIDIKDERIKVFAASTSIFDIYDWEEKSNYNSTILYFYTIDSEGDKCRIRFRYSEDEDDRQMYIDYPRFSVVYTIKPMRDY
ncbi:MAG: hypothetical protein JSS63_14735 [Bacteroidetes bacterium]|nr:hypothetical protein [Bacteroidota bacterium]